MPDDARLALAVRRLRRRTAQGGDPRAPRGVGLAADRLRARRPPPGHRAGGPRRAARVLHLPRLRALHRGLPRRRGPAARARGHPAADLRGGHRHGGAEHPLRRAHADPRHLGAGRRADRGVRRGRRGRAGRGRAGPRHPAALDLRHPRRVRPAGGGGDGRATRWPARSGDADRLRARRSRGRRRTGRSSTTSSPRPAPPACTACRTPARRPVRRRCGTRCATSAPSGSGTARPPCRTPSWWPTSSSTASRSRSARPPTSPPARWTGSRTTPSGRCTTPGITVTVNSDDPPMFGTTLNREYEIAARPARPRRGGHRRDWRRTPCARPTWTSPGRARCWPRSTPTWLPFRPARQLTGAPSVACEPGPASRCPVSAMLGWGVREGGSAGR